MSRNEILEKIMRLRQRKVNSSYFVYTYFKSDTSLPRKFIMLEVNMKLEKTVNSPAITEITSKYRYIT